MYIRCWGSRGSIPVSGKEFTTYGGDTTCMEIRAKSGELIIIDAGTGIRRLGNKLITENVRHIEMLFTHAHWDHLIGFPFFKPLFIKGVDITIRSLPLCLSSVKNIFEGLMKRPYFPVQLGDKDVRARIHFKKLPRYPFSIGSIKIHSIPLSHPKDGGAGFRFEENGKSFVFLTDNELGYTHKGGCSFDEYSDFCTGTDLLIHDAEFTQKEYQKILKTSQEPWGHSVVSDAVRLGLSAGVKQLGLFHLNATRSDDSVDQIVRKTNESIKRKKKSMVCFAVGSSFETTL